jgi:hypothetical protein
MGKKLTTDLFGTLYKRKSKKYIKKIKMNNNIFSIKTLHFWMTIVISLIVLVVSTTKLFIGTEQEKAIYIGLICSIIGLWFPNPKLPQIENISEV